MINILENIKEKYKICFVGNGHDKTSLFVRIISNNYSKNSGGICFGIKSFELKNGKKVELQLWDIAGQEKYRELSKTKIKNSDYIVIVFDITKKETFDDVKKCWYPIVKKILKTNLIYLIWNKIDLYEQEEVDPEEAENFAIENNLRYFATSCKTGKGIDKFLLDLKNEIIKI